MIRFLILLMALNTIFTPVNGASFCVSSNMSDMRVGDARPMTSDVHNAFASMEHAAQQSAFPPSSRHFNRHCNHSGVFNHCGQQGNDMTGSMSGSDCDVGCCASCTGVSAPLVASFLTPVAHANSLQPVSGSIHFHSRTVTPELHPPLV